MKKSERTRLLILEQAAPLFNQKGIAGTTIDDILAATKLTKGGLYGHFENKSELAHETVNFLFSNYSVKLGAVLSSESTTKGKLFAFLDFFKTPVSPMISGGCPILNFGVESDDTNPEVRQKVKTVIERLIKRFSDIIRQGIENKELSKDFNADQFALKMLIMIEGSMLISRVLGSNKEMNLMINILKNEIELYTFR